LGQSNSVFHADRALFETRVAKEKQRGTSGAKDHDTVNPRATGGEARDARVTAARVWVRARARVSRIARVVPAW
jgi:hypothetical protein